METYEAFVRGWEWALSFAAWVGFIALIWYTVRLSGRVRHLEQDVAVLVDRGRPSAPAVPRDPAGGVYDLSAPPAPRRPAAPRS